MTDTPPNIVESVTNRVEAQPANTEEPAARGDGYYLSIGDQYARIALESPSPSAKRANAQEAAKYYGIAERVASASRSR